MDTNVELQSCISWYVVNSLNYLIESYTSLQTKLNALPNHEPAPKRQKVDNAVCCSISPTINPDTFLAVDA